MRRLGPAGRPVRARYRETANAATVEDLVTRDFARAEPNRIWLTDITEHATREERVSAVQSCSTRSHGASWAGRSTCRKTANFVVNALAMAIENRQAERVAIHSDHAPNSPPIGLSRKQ